MWFRRTPTIEKLRDYKRVRVCGMAFTIRRINPLVDFPDGKMPMIFTSFISRRKVDPAELATPEKLAALHADMGAVIMAGVVDPPIVPAEKSAAGITVVDLFRIAELGYKLYFEVMNHSLNQFSGWRRLFFSIKTRRLLSIQLRNNTANSLST
jgi:hypothetical protein